MKMSLINSVHLKCRCFLEYSSDSDYFQCLFCQIDLVIDPSKSLLTLGQSEAEGYPAVDVNLCLTHIYLMTLSYSLCTYGP